MKKACPCVEVNIRLTRCGTCGERWGGWDLKSTSDDTFAKGAVKKAIPQVFGRSSL
jgi:hypothetical protein